MQEKAKIYLAPMAGVTDMPFRLICKEMGCTLTYTEMVSAKGLHYSPASSACASRSKSMLAIGEGEVPCAIQLFGSDPEIMAEQASILEKEQKNQIALIDINMGCPARKIIANGEGSALMKNLELASKIIKAVKSAVSLPVSIKFRKGYDEKSINAIEFAQMAEESGASNITIHGRTREQFYSGKADWDIIKKVKSAVKIPVIGNGDIFSANNAKAMLEQTNCDGVMIARGAQGNPWIFKQTASLLNDGIELSAPCFDEVIDMAKRHLDAMIAFKGERAVIEMRKHIAWYLSNFHGASKIRNAVNQSKSRDSIIEILEEYRAYLKSR